MPENNEHTPAKWHDDDSEYDDLGRPFTPSERKRVRAVLPTIELLLPAIATIVEDERLKGKLWGILKWVSAGTISLIGVASGVYVAIMSHHP